MDGFAAAVWFGDAALGVGCPGAVLAAVVFAGGTVGAVTGFANGDAPELLLYVAPVGVCFDPAPAAGATAAVATGTEVPAFPAELG
jgi:hypothetical protein